MYNLQKGFALKAYKKSNIFFVFSIKIPLFSNAKFFFQYVIVNIFKFIKLNILLAKNIFSYITCTKYLKKLRY